MIRFGRLLVLFALLALPGPPVGAQQPALADMQSKLTGSWLVTVEGEPRTRTLVIGTVAQKSEGTYLILGTFNFSDDPKTYPFKDGEVLQSSGNVTLVFATGAGSIYTVTAKADGNLAGTTKYSNGQVKPVSMVKGAVPVPVAAAAAITEFDGKWTGGAMPTSNNCVRGVYDLTIKDGRISGTATFNAQMGVATSTVAGQVQADKTSTLVLARQQSFGRSSRFTVNFEGGRLKGRDQTSGGSCTYDVDLARG